MGWRGSILKALTHDSMTTDPTPQACAVPLQELLRHVPKDFREWFRSHDGATHGMTHIPVGLHCHNAAELIDLLTARLHQSEAIREEMRAAMQECADYFKAQGAGHIYHYAYANDKLREERFLKALSTTSGTGWLSPDEAAKLREENERLKAMYKIAAIDRAQVCKTLAESNNENDTLRARVAKLEGALRQAPEPILSNGKLTNLDAIDSWWVRVRSKALTPPPPSQAMEDADNPTHKTGTWLPKPPSQQEERPKLKIGDKVRFKFDHPDVPKTISEVTEAAPDVDGNWCVKLNNGCWYGAGAFDLVPTAKEEGL